MSFVIRTARECNVGDELYWDYNQNCFGIDIVLLDKKTIHSVYKEFLSPSAQIKTVAEIWNDGRPPRYSLDVKDAIFHLAIKQPAMDPLIAAIYLLALKHDCLHLLESIVDISDHAMEDLIPFDVKLLFFDMRKLADFYGKYGKKSPRKVTNKIKFKKQK